MIQKISSAGKRKELKPPVVQGPRSPEEPAASGFLSSFRGAVREPQKVRARAPHIAP